MDLNDTLAAAARRLEIELKTDSEELRQMGAQLIIDLGMAVGEPGYEEAVLAARDTIALQVGLDAASAGDLADAEVRGIIFGFLVAAAK